MFIKALLLYLLGSVVLVLLVAGLAALLVHLDGPLWASLVAIAAAGVLALVAQLLLAAFIESRF